MSDSSVKLHNDALDAIQAGQLEKAISLIEEALTEDPVDSLCWQLYVRLLNASGRTADAAKATEKLKSLGLSDLDELMIEAAKHLSSGDLDSAIKCYEAAIGIEPGNPDIRSSLAMALLEKGEKEAALETARKAVELAPDDSRANYALGHMLRLEGQKEEALEALTKSLADEPDFTLALYEQGMLLVEKNRLEEALSNFEKFLEVHPDDPGATTALEEINRALKRTDTY